jgi:GNAT superfamily N-acetyltransferase
MEHEALHLRALEGVEDGERLQTLFGECADWYERAFGHPPFPAEAQSAFLSGLEQVGPDDKYLVGAFRHQAERTEAERTGITQAQGDDSDNEAADLRLVGVLDSIRGYPKPGWWTVGLLLVTPTARRQGVGSRLLRALERECIRWGAVGLRVQATPAGDTACARFLAAQGFQLHGPVDWGGPPTDIYAKELVA